MNDFTPEQLRALAQTFDQAVAERPHHPGSVMVLVPVADCPRLAVLLREVSEQPQAPVVSQG